MFFRTFTLLALLAGANVLCAAEATPAPRAPGRLVDVGGYRVHLHCTGSGSPTVFIAGGFSVAWALVQPEIAKLTTVCTYDPAGTAWSDPGPWGTCRDRVDEIRHLVEKAPLERPFLLAGFSMGALVARRYASMYPNDVAGVILIDHAFLPVQGRSDPAGDETSLTDRPPLLIEKTPIDVSVEDSARVDQLPKEQRELLAWADLHQPSAETRAGMAEECSSELDHLPESKRSLDPIPLAVVSTGNTADGYAELQKRLLSLSPGSRHWIADNSFHSVEIDQPEVVIAAVKAMLLTVSRRRVP